MERSRFSQTMASEWQTAFVVSHKMPWCALLTAVKNYNKSLEKLQDFFFKTETKTKTKCSRPRREDQDQDFHFCPRGASRPRPWSRGLHHWHFPPGTGRLTRVHLEEWPLKMWSVSECAKCIFRITT